MQFAYPNFTSCHATSYVRYLL